MLDEMLVFMAQAGKDVFSADEVAAALHVPESDVTRLYRQASDQGWVRKFSDKPPMFRLTGSGAQHASRALARRAVPSAGAYPGGGVSGAGPTATEVRRRLASPRRLGAAVCVVLAAAAAVAKLWEFCEGHWWCVRAVGACSAFVLRWWWLPTAAAALAVVVGVLVWVPRRVRAALGKRAAPADTTAQVARQQPRLPSAMGEMSREETPSGDDCRGAVRNLGVPALQVLFRALVKYEQGGTSTVRVELNDLARSWAGTGEDVSLKVVRQACSELKTAGLLKGHSAFGGKGSSGVSLPLSDCLRERPSARKVQDWCNDRLVELRVWDP